MMWQGDPYINAYIQNFVAPELQRRYGVTLRITPGQGTQVVTALMTEIDAKRPSSSFDLAWINGETFYQLRQINALYGPFTDRLPNAKSIDFSNRFIAYDFQQRVSGYECPWGNVQMAIIHNSERVPVPPRNRAELAAWVRKNPGRFTFDTTFAGMTFLKGLLIDVAGGERELAGPFDEAKYKKYSRQLWDYINSIKPYFWKRGETFPAQLAQLHQMFANGEVDFTISNNDGEVDNKVGQGLFPKSSRAYVLDSGTIQNSHFMGITRNSAHLAGALVTVNFLISAEAQLEKAKPAVWGDGTILDIKRLTPEWQAKFAALPKRQFGPERSEIQSKALMELSPEYMIRLYDDFRSEVIQK
ncbi:MAG TPA: ABC transporter substrate-binding protein, partial [Thermoanaerobaculia bacterium]|nr:ABC transporter substrate-binding protein [Thermoanaerobaculia bacterium]